jgi:TP901 family phage tail tape measure protein
MASIGTIKVRVGADIRGLQNGLFKAERRLKAFGRSTGELADGINRGITLPFAIAGLASVKVASDFESSMTKITSQVGIAREEVEKMKGQVLDLAGNTARAPKELADAMFFVQSAGLRGAEAMDALEMSAKAASAGFGDTKTVADLLTSAMNAYGPAALSAEMATDTLAATVREGKANAEDLTRSMGAALPMATAMGIEFNQLGAAIAGMTRTGTTADTAVTQLTQIMMTFQKPMKQTVDVVESLGYTMSELRDRIAKQGLMPVLVELRRRLDEAGIQTAELFREKRALAGVLDLTGGNMEDNIAIMERMNDVTGDSAKAFEVAGETAEFKFNQALANLQKSSIELGTTLLPLAVDFTDKLSSLVTSFSSLDDANKKNIVRFGALAVAVGGSLKVISMASLAFGGLSKAGYLVARSIQQATISAKTFDRVIGATKIGLLVTGLMLAYEGYQFLTGSVEKYSKHQSELNNQLEATSKAHKDELTEVDNLFSTLKSAESTQEQRIAAYKRLNEISPDVVKNINEETRSLDKLNAAQEAVNKSLTAKQYHQLSESIASAEGKLKDLRARLIDVKGGAKPSQEELRRFSDEVYNTEGVISAFGANIQGAFSPTEEMKSGAAGIKLMINDLIGQLEKLKQQRGAFDVDLGDVNIPSGGNRGSYYKEQFEKEQAQIEKELATKKAAEGERKRLREEREKSVKKLYATLASELRKADEMFIVHGNVQDKTSDKTGAYLSAIEGLIDEGFTAGSRAVQGLILKMNMVQAEFDAFSSARLISEVEKIGDVQVPPINIPFEKVDISSFIDNVDEGGVKIPVDLQLNTGFAKAIESLFEGLNLELPEKALRKIDAAAHGISVLDGLWGAMNEKQQVKLDEDYQKELSRIESSKMAEEQKEQAKIKLQERFNAKQKELGKQMAKRQKAASIAQSIINTAEAVTAALKAGPLIGPILAGVVGSLGAAQTAVIASTPLGYNQGGKVKVQEGKVTGITNATPRADGDHILAYLKAGEAVLNQQQIAAIGGPKVLAAANVPGFSGGGSTGGSRSNMLLPLEKVRASKRLHITWDEPRWEGEEFVLGIKSVEEIMGNQNAI